jgi:hypothetical protein
MSHKAEIIAAFERHGWTMTLGQLLEEGRFSFAHKLTARLSDLRDEGYVITCTEGEKPTDNLYEMRPKFTFNPQGQGEMFRMGRVGF